MWFIMRGALGDTVRVHRFYTCRLNTAVVT
jgi:hypothetical protein